MEKRGYELYMLRCADGSLYTGTAVDADKRLAAHSAGRGAKYTRSRLPVELVYREPCLDRGDALRREIAVKSLSREKKEELFAPAPGLHFLDKLWYRDFVDMEALENSCYSERYITPGAEAYAWYGKLPFSAYVARDGGRMAGFVNLFPVTENAYRSILNGSLNDQDLKEEDVADLRTAAPPLRMFLSCVAVEKRYRRTGLVWRLLYGAAKPYLSCGKDIATVATDNVTPEGERLSQRMGMSFMGKSGHDSMIYQAAWEDFLRFLKEKLQMNGKI